MIRTLLRPILRICLPFLLGILVTLLGIRIYTPGMMIHEAKSPYDFDATIAMIENTASNLGWRIPKVYNFQETILREGQGDIGKMKVVEMCHPEYAYGLLSHENNKHIGVMMPCAVAVYEKADGSTWVSSMNVGTMGKLFGGEISRMMSRVAEDDDKILVFLN